MVTGYLIAPVRGHDGDNVSPETKQANVDSGVRLAWAIRKTFPKLNLYAPHESERIVGLFWQHGDISADTIVERCIEIMLECDIVIAFIGQGISEGMEREMETAIENNKPLIEFEIWDDAAKQQIATATMRAIENSVNGYVRNE